MSDRRDPKDKAIQEELVALFRAELGERLEAMDQGLISLEAGGDPKDILEGLFREAHSLKGAARAVGLAGVENLAHAMESALSAAGRAELEMVPEVVDTLLRAKDVLPRLSEMELAGDPDGQRSVEELCDVLKQLAVSPKDAQVGQLARGSGGGSTKQRADSSPQPENPVEPGSVKSDDFIRVSAAKIDSLMDHVEELIIAGMRSKQRISELAVLMDEIETEGQSTKVRELAEAMSREEARVSHILGDLSDGVRQARMLPADRVFRVFPRVVRDLAKQTGKQVDLQIVGAQVEMDRHVLDGIMDPLTHLVRNAVDHGLEGPDERSKAGKPSPGKIWIRALQQGASVVIEVEDDGRGIDLDAVQRRATNAPKGDSAETTDSPDPVLTIFEPGFSTRSEVGSLSGRGVGLDVVRESIEKLGGVITVTSRPGEGCRFSMRLPLTLTTQQALLVEAGGQQYALPASAIELVMQAEESEITMVGGEETVWMRGRPIRLASLENCLGRASTGSRLRTGRIRFVVVGSSERRAALEVDRFLGQAELVLRPLAGNLVRVRNVAGASILGTGKVVMVLNVSDLIKTALNVKRTTTAPGTVARKSSAAKTVLVVDDSITTRTLEKRIIEGAGFRAKTAADGQEALQFLQEEHCDLVLSDIDMPRVSGIELTRRVRADGRLANLPVVLLTALGSDEDKAKGVDAGADAYLVKKEFDQGELLKTVRGLL